LSAKNSTANGVKSSSKISASNSKKNTTNTIKIDEESISSENNSNFGIIVDGNINNNHNNNNFHLPRKNETVMINKKTSRNEEIISPSKEQEEEKFISVGIYGNKKLKLDKEIKEYTISRDIAEKQIKENNNFIGIKLCYEKENTCNIFNNIVIKIIIIFKYKILETLYKR
jgi:hypothetical protein